MLGLEPAEKSDHRTITPLDKNTPILPWSVFTSPSAAWRVTLILMDIVHPTADPEGFTEHEKPFPLTKQRLEVTECVAAGPSSPAID